jgi:hypothetical protein
MVLGQIVSYSFATNLFILALLLSPPVIPAAATSGIHKRRWLGPWLVNFVAIIATEWSAFILSGEVYWHTKPIVPVLVIPHVALLALPIASSVLPAKYFTDDDVDFAGSVYKYLWITNIVGGLLVWLNVTSAAYAYSGIYGMFNALLEHHAVSTVGFDVIFCWISWAAWWVLRQRGLNAVLESRQKNNEDNWDGVGSATAASDVVSTGTLRRR